MWIQSLKDSFLIQKQQVRTRMIPKETVTQKSLTRTSHLAILELGDKMQSKCGFFCQNDS